MHESLVTAIFNYEVAEHRLICTKKERVEDGRG